MNLRQTSMTIAIAALAGVAIVAARSARADAITDWNVKAAEIVSEARIGTPPAVRVMAIVQTATLDAVVDASRTRVGTPVAIDAAVASAHRATLAKLLPAQSAAIETAAQAALATLPDGAAKSAGIAAGEKAASAVLARRADDGVATPDDFKPHAAAGAWVPTAAPAAFAWPARKTWVLASASQFRPGPPPALASATWARDFNEVKSLGSRSSTKRTAEQTDVARFWDFSLPAIYHGAVRSVANAPGRDVVANARLLAAVAQGMDDGLIAVMDAKYHYRFWRPVTAIRNADADGNDATEADPTWISLIDSPLHPEYPSAHSVLAATVATVIAADLAGAPLPVLATASPTAKGATRRWTSLDAFVLEVGESRIWGGIHYRSAVEVGQAMGRRIGEEAAKVLLKPAP